jgi:hypothetical protein
MAYLGHPSTRDEEGSCYIATSYDLDRERLDWEDTSIVAWVIAAPSGTDRTDVEDVFRRKFRLRASELLVSSHFPEQSPFNGYFSTSFSPLGSFPCWSNNTIISFLYCIDTLSNQRFLSLLVCCVHSFLPTIPS